jgi:hypothetical protein
MGDKASTNETPLLLSTDAVTEAVRALEKAAELLPTVERDPYQWKWVLIALHNAVQGFMVLALEGSWHVRALTRKDAKRLVQAHDAEVAKPEHERTFDWMFQEVKLDYFMELYGKVQDEKEMPMSMVTKVLVPQGTQTSSMEKLNRLRNQFIHFVPVRLTEYVGDWPEMVADGAAVVSFLAFESGNVTWDLDGELEGQTRRHLSTLSEEAARLTAFYYRIQR